MNRKLFATGALALLLAGCGGGGTTDTSSTDTTALPTARSVETSVFDALATSEAGSQSAINRIKASNAILAETADWLSTTRAVYTKTVGTVTATVTVTATSKTKSNFTIVLNGTAGSVTYTNFTWCAGTIEVATDKTTKKAGSHVLSTWYTLKDASSVVRATGDAWFYTDGSAQGSLTGSDGTATVFTRSTADVWVFTVYTDASKTVKLADGTVNADKSGTATLYCTTDGKTQAQATWTAAKTGQVCVFATACATTDVPCSSFPK